MGTIAPAGELHNSVSRLAYWLKGRRLGGRLALNVPRFVSIPNRIESILFTLSSLPVSLTLSPF